MPAAFLLVASAVCVGRLTDLMMKNQNAAKLVTFPCTRWWFRSGNCTSLDARCGRPLFIG